ncbi:nitroreductase family protein [Candidatus Micrarchaeota archaeon]|nr:nitroreductase family protein [Candidatus Micrarchaeota archaeon]
MQFYEVLEKRHSCREFSDKPIEPEKLQNILNTVASCPTAGNLQAYKVYVVRSKETREALAQAALGQNPVIQAPIVLVFCADKDHSGKKYGERGEELYALQDATIAASYSQLAAEAEGLSSVWVGAFEPLEVSYILKTEAAVVPIALIPIGYRNGPVRVTQRRPLEEIVKEV